MIISNKFQTIKLMTAIDPVLLCVFFPSIQGIGSAISTLGGYPQIWSREPSPDHYPPKRTACHGSQEDTSPEKETEMSTGPSAGQEKSHRKVERIDRALSCSVRARCHAVTCLPKSTPQYSFRPKPRIVCNFDYITSFCFLLTAVLTLAM